MANSNNLLTHSIPIISLVGIIGAVAWGSGQVGSYVERFETATATLSQHIEDHPNIDLGGIRREVKEIKEKGDKTALAFSNFKKDFKVNVIDIVKKEFIDEIN